MPSHIPLGASEERCQKQRLPFPSHTASPKGFPFPAGLALHSERRGSPLPARLRSSRGLRRSPQGPSPLQVAPQTWGCGKGLHKPQAAPSRDASTPDPAGDPPSRSPAPHLLGRHRPLARAAPAALAGATAVIRHLRRLLGFRPAQLCPPELRHVRFESCRPLAPAPLGIGPADGFGCIFM